MRLGVDRGTHLGQRASGPHKTGRTHARSRTRSEILSPNPLHLRGRPHTPYGGRRRVRGKVLLASAGVDGVYFPNDVPARFPRRLSHCPACPRCPRPCAGKLGQGGDGGWSQMIWKKISAMPMTAIVQAAVRSRGMPMM